MRAPRPPQCFLRRPWCSHRLRLPRCLRHQQGRVSRSLTSRSVDALELGPADGAGIVVGAAGASTVVGAEIMGGASIVAGTASGAGVVVGAGIVVGAAGASTAADARIVGGASTVVGTW